MRNEMILQSIDDLNRITAWVRQKRGTVRYDGDKRRSCYRVVEAWKADVGDNTIWLCIPSMNGLSGHQQTWNAMAN